jgi:hypothetical protein
MSKGSKGGQSRNDQRSRAMNPQDAVGQMAVANRAVQLNPTSPTYKSSRTASTETTENTAQSREE